MSKTPAQSSGFFQLPLRTPTLPPAEHTNAYFIGSERFIIVDPAPYEEDERGRLLQAVQARTLRGDQVEMIVLTHHHHDHYGAAQWLSDRLQRPIAAHPVTRSLLAEQAEITITLEEGETIGLGPYGTLEVLFTPGHAPGHICLFDKERRVLVVGDMVASIGSILIDPDDGDIAVYLEQLSRLKALGPTTVLPAHGAPIDDGPAKFDAYIRHRLAREQKVLAAIEGRNGSFCAEDLLDKAYDDTPKALYPLAARACLAHLIKLNQDGTLNRDGARFRSLA